MNPIVRKYLQKQIFTQKGVIGSAQSVEFAYNALKTRMKNIGLDINLIKSEKDLTQALGFVKNIEDQVFAKQFGDTLKKKESATILDLKGKKLDPNEPIMGGTQEDSIKKNIAEATKKGDFKGIANQVLRDPDIARDFMLAKKFPFRRDLNVRSGEDAIPLARAAKFDEETKDLNISLTPGKDAEGSVGEFVDQMKKFGVKDKDIQMMLGSGKSGQVDYVMEQYGLSASDVVNLLKQGKPLIEGLAQGGRIGFKEGNGNDEGMTGIALSIEERMERIKKLLKQMQDIQKGKGVDPDPEEKAEGGRAGFRVGKKVIEKIIKPKKTLKSIEETGMIDISDPDIAEEFAKFMKQMDPEGSAKIQKIVDDINQRSDLRAAKKEKGRKENSDGGRIGLKVGSPSKRAFLKIASGIAATIAAIKSGLIGTGGKEATKQVVKETAKDVASAPPKYFFDLANKIKLLGKESKVKPQERVNEYNYVGKNGDEYTLTEDISTGDMQIVKDKGGVGVADDKTFDTIEDRTVMNYKKGRGDETTKGTPADEYDEFKVEFDVDGTPADGDVISENIKKEIIEEASEIPERKIKRAGGGVAYMLGE